jgi:hypothetical protein
MREVRKIGEPPPNFTAALVAGSRVEILFDQHQSIERVFVIVFLAGTIGIPTSQAEAP